MLTSLIVPATLVGSAARRRRRAGTAAGGPQRLRFQSLRPVMTCTQWRQPVGASVLVVDWRLVLRRGQAVGSGRVDPSSTAASYIAAIEAASTKRMPCCGVSTSRPWKTSASAPQARRRPFPPAVRQTPAPGCPREAPRTLSAAPRPRSAPIPGRGALRIPLSPCGCGGHQAHVRMVLERGGDRALDLPQRPLAGSGACAREPTEGQRHEGVGVLADREGSRLAGAADDPPGGPEKPTR